LPSLGEQALAEMGFYLQRLENLEGYRLDQLLWSRAAGCILVSATLRALNQFTYFCRQAGISEADGVRFLALASPFDYQNNARLVIPAVKYEPQAPQFTDLLIEVLPEYLEGETASLVLFSSYWQMNKVAEALRPLAKKVKPAFYLVREAFQKDLIYQGNI